MEIKKAIPTELKELKQWVLWKLEYNSKKKSTKVPYSIKGHKASSMNKSHWSTYDEVIKEFTNCNYDGIGFVFSKEDNYVGIDFDNCIENGVIVKWVKDIIEDCSSYAEISQSGKGIHIIVKGTLKNAIKRKECEMYSQGRYFTISQNMISNTSNITENQKLINKLYNNYSKKESTTDNISKDYKDSEIKELMNKAFTSNQGFKIEALYKGEWQKLYNSQSEADQALCNYLAYWLDRDFNNIDKVFKKSGLYRSKWDREDYKNQTINNSIKSCIQSYQEFIKENNKESSPIWQENNHYNKKLKNGVAVISNFIINPIRFIDCIDNQEQSSIEVEICTEDNHKFIKRYRATDFDNIQNFDKATNDFRTRFTGSTQDLKIIKVIVFNKVNTHIKAFNCGGIHYLNNNWYFLDNKSCIGTDGLVAKDVILLNDNGCITSSLSEKECINKEELQQLSKYLFEFNTHEITTSIIGYISVLLIKEKLKALNIKFSHLFYSGEAGSGKSETLENIIIPLLCMDNNIVSADGCTKFALEKLLNSNNTIPLIIDEYKPGWSSKSKIKLISSILRNNYDGHSSLRGTKDLSVDNKVLEAPIVLCGEASSSETASIERSLLLTFSRMYIKEEKRKVAFKMLKDNKELLNKLGRSLLEKALCISLDEIKSNYDKAFNDIGNIEVDRVRNTEALLLVGVYIIQSLYHDLGLNFEDETGLNYEYIKEIIHNSILNEILGENSCSTKSIIDISLEYINDMFTKIHCDNDANFARVMKDDFGQDDILAIRMRQVYMEFVKYIKDYNIQDEKFLSWNDFRNQLQKSEYHISHNVTVKFKDLKEFGENKRDRKCFKLDINKMRELNIDISTILEKAEGN